MGGESTAVPTGYHESSLPIVDPDPRTSSRTPSLFLVCPAQAALDWATVWAMDHTKPVSSLASATITKFCGRRAPRSVT